MENSGFNGSARGHPANGNLSVPVSSMDNSAMNQSHSVQNVGQGAPVDDRAASSLDHTLLESLFYNEMVLLDSTPLSPSFVSQSLSEVASPAIKSHPGVADAHTIAEKALLRDFGVTSSPLHPGATETGPWIPEPNPAHNAAQNLAQNPVEASNPSVAVPAVLPQASNATIHTGQPVPIQSPHPTTSITSTPPRNTPMPPAPVTSAETKSAAPQTPVSHERAKQLVSQFATLASRLGIDLPTNVLQSLTTAAAMKDPKTFRTAAAVAPGSSQSMPLLETNSPTQQPQLATTQSGVKEELNQVLQPATSVSKNATTPVGVAPTVEALRQTAEEAIAAVSVNRKRPQEDPSESTAAGTSSVKPLYSKRRKKPRLSDCETKLAQLKAENELLKRHLENVSNKAHRFEQEKSDAGNRIMSLLEEGAGHEKMDKCVQEFTEMYSDYGRQRQQELSFHLEQLQRLVNPTNFTKMGLWTLGQNSSNPKRNPIAGILQKELDISPQQGRKILDQREKIRALCVNLKECVALLARLKSLCAQKTQLFHDRMSKCKEILTSTQVVKLIIWINDNTQLLESVCPGWGTEHIHSKVPPS